jgi:hypothetical protein
MPKIYISGPISGLNPSEVSKSFAEAEKWLKRQGFVPVSPLNNGLPESATYTEHMLRDLQMLSECDEVYMLEGWENSRGCRMEIAEAASLKKTIKFQQ